MGNNRIIVAAAGSGKTSLLVEEASKIKNKNILIVTFTENNEAEIKSRLQPTPKNVKTQTWYSFLLQHAIRPYQDNLFSDLFDATIQGVNLVSGQSVRGTRKADKRHYFDKSNRIYTDKLCKLILKDDEVKESIINRLTKIYDYIFIDEIQDLAGYDLNFLTMLFDSKIKIWVVGDPRQGTYSTNESNKNKKYKKSAIVNYFSELHSEIKIEDDLLNNNYRCPKAACSLSDQLYPSYKPTVSANQDEGFVFLVKEDDIEDYLNKHNSMQLRWDSKNTKISSNAPVINYGNAKGCAYENTLIFPTAPIIGWIKNRKFHLSQMSKAKFYVALTRANGHVGIVYDHKEDEDIEGVIKYIPK